MTVTKPSNALGPILDLTLPASVDPLEIILRNSTTGKTLTINLPAAWAGDDLSLDFENRTITDQAGADRSALLDAEDNELWSVAPLIAGVNDVEVEALLLESSTKSPGTVADELGSSEGAVAWSNVNNAKASDNSYATAVLTEGANFRSHYLKATNYGFVLPAGAVIDGILFSPERSYTLPLGENKAKDAKVRLVKAGVVQSAEDKTDIFTFYGTVDAVAPHGGAGDLWSNVWSKTDVENSGFGVVLAVQSSGSTARVDAMPITVFYRRAAAYGATAELRWVQSYY